MAPSLNHAQDVCGLIDQRMITVMYRNHRHKFLPKSTLDEITTQDVIRRIVQEDDDLSLNNHELEILVSKVHQNGRRLFATIVHGGWSMNHLRIMLDNGLTDNSTIREKDDFGSLRGKRNLVESFLGNQKRFNALYFKEDWCENLEEGDSDTFSIPIQFEESQSNKLGSGAFGDVWKVEIPADQRSFPCNTNDEDLFAMKVTQHEGREQNYHRAMAGLGHPHLVKCLASFTLGSQYQMVYELANFDLEAFMQKFQSPLQHPALTSSWFVGQLAGLSGAIHVVHNQEGSMLQVPRTKADQMRTGYIHDIKPDNILVFTYRGTTHCLKLSDFSCAKVVDVIATISGRRESYKTGNKKGTIVYRAPEAFSDKGISRPYDLWALGCVFLELLVWYVEGFKALEAFRTGRKGQAPSGIIDEGFFFQAGDGSFQLRPEVQGKIKHLSHKCEGELKAIIDIIPWLLKIKPQERLTASQLVDKLKHFSSNTHLGVGTSYGGSLTVPIRASPNLPTCDSDSDFEGLVKVIRPSDE